MKSRSAKTQRLYRERRHLVAALLEANPWCQIRWSDGCTGRATDVDEILSRAAGGSILDPANCQTSCRFCHSMKHAHPNEACERGLTRKSWEGSRPRSGEEQTAETPRSA